MKAWFEGLAPRERHMVLGGATVLVLVGLWLLVLEPLGERKALLERAVPSQQALLAWLREASTSPAAPSASGSLFAVVDRSARASGMSGSVNRIQPEGENTVRLWLESAAFDELVVWLAALERDAGIIVTALAVDRTAEAGRVNARVTLERR